MEVITLLKINELYNIKDNITQIGGLVNDPKLKEIQLMHDEISNKLNELQIETTVTDTEGVFKYNYIVTLLVNGDNLSYFNQEDDAKYIGFVAKVYNGDLSLDFNDCEVDYIL